MSQQTAGNSFDFSNMFGNLTVEETEASDLNISATDEIVSGPSKSTGRVYELELDDDSELPFIILCFFEQLEAVRKFLKKTWLDFSNNQLDHITASLLTNVAFS